MKPNLFTDRGVALVARVHTSGELTRDIDWAVAAVGGLERLVQPGDTILVKPNFNTADPPPASSDPRFVQAVVELLYAYGAGRVILGESSMLTLSTEKVLRQVGIFPPSSSSPSAKGPREVPEQGSGAPAAALSSPPSGMGSRGVPEQGGGAPAAALSSPLAGRGPQGVPEQGGDARAAALSSPPSGPGPRRVPEQGGDAPAAALSSPPCGGGPRGGTPDVLVFDRWVSVKTGGRYLKRVAVAQAALEAAKIVYLPCLKTHRLADFTMSLKLAMGFVRPRDRILMHLRHLREKLVDLNLVIAPDLIIMDARRCFISGGPSEGELREPGLILASGDRVALDVEGLRTIQSYPDHGLPAEPWSLPMIRRAAALGLGASSDARYRTVETGMFS